MYMGKISDQQIEVDNNYKEFVKVLKNIAQSHYGQFALMKSGEIIEYFDSWQDANKAGHLSFKDEPFSIQEVTDQKVDLGFYSRANV